MSQETKPALRGEGILFQLERIQNWIVDHWKFLVLLLGVAFVGAYSTQIIHQKSIDQQLATWELASKAKTTAEKETFVRQNLASNAAGIVSLELTRELLDAVDYAKAETIASLFLDNHAEHVHRPLAYYLRALAREELGKKSEALADIQKVTSDKTLGMLATAAAERLK